jgi:hypothetical protein
MLHLGERFKRSINKWDASQLHELMRDLGDVITPHTKHEAPRPDSPRAGHFKQPAPEEWVIHQK